MAVAFRLIASNLSRLNVQSEFYGACASDRETIFTILFIYFNWIVVVAFVYCSSTATMYG